MLSAAIMRRLPVNVRRIRMLRDRAYIALGGGGWDENDAVDAKWPSTLQYARSRSNDMEMELDLTDWCQRRSFFTGRFYQEELEDLISLILRPGDTFVDIGANIGLVTLHAASIVGDNVWSFEPNPDVFARLSHHLELNGLDQSHAFNMGVGEEDATLTLKLYGRHTGKATLVGRSGPVAKNVDVQIRRGDEIIEPSGPAVFKIDVEGFEDSVLKGLGKLLDFDVALVIEVSRPWLQRAGSSAEELHELLAARGFRPYCFELQEKRFSRSLVVEPIDGPLPDEQYDCLFMRPGSVFSERAHQ